MSKRSYSLSYTLGRGSSFNLTTGWLGKTFLEFGDVAGDLAVLLAG